MRRGHLIEATISKKELIQYRAYFDDDLHFVLSTWLRGLCYNSTTFHGISRRSFFSNYEPILKTIIKKCAGKKVACLVEDPSVILGYCFFDVKDARAILHYIYVKHSFRRNGIARDLMPKNVRIATHMTNLGQDLIQKKFKHIQFDPFKL